MPPSRAPRPKADSGADVILLAGGLGTRLRPLTFAVPKPLLPVGDRPILEVLLAHLRSQGFDTVHLALGYRAELIETYFQDGRRLGLRLIYTRERRRLGTAGPLRAIRDECGLRQTCLVMNADIVTRLDIRRMLRFHAAHRSHLTVGMRTFTYQLPFGMIRRRGPRLVRIVEKPAVPFDVSAGIYVLEPEILDLVPRARFFDMPDLIARAVARRRRVFCYPITEDWIGIEELHQLEEARNLLKNGRLRGR